ncbi:hypothetical protein ACF3OE_00460 [Capnocytophaga canis]
MDEYVTNIAIAVYRTLKLFRDKKRKLSREEKNATKEDKFQKPQKPKKQ